jgi:hypothetical protein
MLAADYFGEPMVSATLPELGGFEAQELTAVANGGDLIECDLYREFGYPADSAGFAAASSFPLAETFQLHSNPGASKVIYLDFDGHTTTGTVWNSDYTSGNPIVTPAFSIEGDSSFSSAELERIQQVWERVSEDFLPFDVDVTTEDPGIEALRNTGGLDSQWGIRVVIGPAAWHPNPVGGTAYVGSFVWASDTPCFVFETSEAGISVSAGHEVGHTLGLSHDGTTSAAYYEGHGAGPTGWAPIMGNGGFIRQLDQWSKGQYPGANNSEDDLAIITTASGFGYRADDHGGTIATASPLNSSGTTFAGDGIIERNTDVDYFVFTTPGGNIKFDIDPFHHNPNLDILATLFNSSGGTVAVSNPTNELRAFFDLNLSAGTYYLSIDGTGKAAAGGDPGYSDYGSLGYYSIRGIPYDLIAAFDMNTNPGWTTAGEWAFGPPTGQGAVLNGNPDPIGGATGTNVYGVALNGDYNSTLGGPWYLTTSAIDCSGYGNVTLEFERWLNTWYAATIDVSNNGSTWTNIFSHSSATSPNDSSWQSLQYDISSVADNQSTVYIRWGYQVDYPPFPFSGWNIDDVTIIGTHLDSLPGDFNGDDVVNALDIDALAIAAHNAPGNLLYDLNGNGVVTYSVSPPGSILSDSDVLVRTILQTQYGDLDLNGQVFLADLSKFATNYRQPGQFGWADGNINGGQEDGTAASPRVFLADLSILATYWRFGVGTGSAIGAALSEPDTGRETVATSQRAASVTLTESSANWQGSRSRGFIKRYGRAEFGGDDLLLLALDRVGRSARQAVTTPASFENVRQSSDGDAGRGACVPQTASPSTAALGREHQQACELFTLSYRSWHPIGNSASAPARR